MSRAPITCDFWARDAFYASWGLLSVGQWRRVKSTLALFIAYQKRDGQIPRRIDRFFTAFHYIGVRVRRRVPKAKYAGAYFVPAMDPNLLFVITCWLYARTSGDDRFLKQHFAAIRRAMEWIGARERGGWYMRGFSRIGRT